LEIAQSLNKAISIDAIFNQVREVVFRYLANVERLALLVDISGEGQLELVNAAARDASELLSEVEGSSWISRSICDRAFSERVAIQTSDAGSDVRFLGAMSIAVQGIKSALAVPLWDKEEVVGVLYADARFASTQPSGEEELSFFSALANLVASSVQRWIMAEKLASESQRRQRLERYHSPSVVRELLTQKGVDASLDPTAFEISVLFCDIVGFTSLSERLSPSKTANMLNLFFGEMLQEIFDQGGTLDKFIGDAIMAFFGAPELQADHAERSVAAARRMLSRLEELNSGNVFPEKLQVRIGINSGTAVVGDVGSAHRVDYTALGSTINLASRLEGLCPVGDCLISESTYRLLKNGPSGWKDFGEHVLKGISSRVRVYRMKSMIG
jgi:adenylate cyclase